jgi:hypothetical protein
MLAALSRGVAVMSNSNTDGAAVFAAWGNQGLTHRIGASKKPRKAAGLKVRRTKSRSKIKRREFALANSPESSDASE